MKFSSTCASTFSSTWTCTVRNTECPRGPPKSDHKRHNLNRHIQSHIVGRLPSRLLCGQTPSKAEQGLPTSAPRNKRRIHTPQLKVRSNLRIQIGVKEIEMRVSPSKGGFQQSLRCWALAGVTKQIDHQSVTTSVTTNYVGILTAQSSHTRTTTPPD